MHTPVAALANHEANLNATDTTSKSCKSVIELSTGLCNTSMQSGIMSRQTPNGLIDWTANGGQRFCHSSSAAAPLPPNHRQR